jgi:aspartate kinase
MIVMKFGGTSVEDADAINRLVEIVRGRLRQRPVVVVSAMAKVTDQLVAMAMAAGAGNLREALQLATAVRRRHLETAGQLLAAQRARELCQQIESDFDGLELVLRSIAALGELTPRTTDSVISMGEVLSSQLVAATFAARGLHGVLVDSRKCIVTDAAHTHALPLFDKTKERLTSQLKPLLQRRQVPVMGGFIAATEAGVPTTIGRGGSDFSASIVGAALGAARIEIWTDVEGMMTTDPNLCPDAIPIREIGFDEAAEMATFGAKVLHPATLLPAMQQSIPVYVLNSRNAKSRGTRIRALVSSSRTLFRAIAAKKKVSIVYIVADRMLRSHGFLYSVFEVFKRHGVPVDIVATSEVSVSLTVESRQATAELLADLRTLAQASYEHGKAIVCMVGKNIRGKPGVAAKVFGAVARAGINVRMISQGASEINVSFVIDEKDVPAAVRALHARFFRRAARPRPASLPEAVLPQPAWTAPTETATGA